MNSQIQFETNGLTVLAVKVPDDSSPSFVMRDRITFDYWDDNSGMWMPDYIMLPEGDWKLHAVTEDIGFKECERLTDTTLMFKTHGVRSYKYKSYEAGFIGFEFAIESFHSLLRSHGIDPAEKWVLLVCE